MANLIPPDAKREVIIEYWLRVVTVWLILIGLGCIAIAVLRVPTFVLVQSQLSAFSGAYNEAVDKTNAFEEAQATLEEANELSALLVDSASTTPITNIIAILDDIAGTEVQINDLRFEKENGDFTEITVSGVAATRIALADFSKDVEAHELFAEAELPISNLAKDRDIAFAISITPEAQ